MAEKARSPGQSFLSNILAQTMKTMEFKHLVMKVRRPSISSLPSYSHTNSDSLGETSSSGGSTTEIQHLDAAENTPSMSSAEEWVHLREIERPVRLSLHSGTCTNLVTITPDGLKATYGVGKESQSPIIEAARILANAPCIPSCSFFYFEMRVTYAGGKPEAAIGFTVIEGEDGDASTKQLGRYKGSCGYHPLQEVIYYHNSIGERGNLHVPTGRTSLKEGKYVIAAGFHKGSSNFVFFMLNGKVVHLLGFNSVNPLERPLYPAVSLHSYNAQVTTSFPSPGRSHHEPWPTCFHTHSLSKSKFSIESETWSTGKQHLFIFYKQPKPVVGKFFGLMADQLVPIGTDIYYFEVICRPETFVDDRYIGLGFCQHSCKDWRSGMPGHYNGSCGISYFGSHAELAQSNLPLHHDRVVIPTVSELSEVRRLGAGIHYGTNEIFFTENGCFIGLLPKRVTGRLKPVFAIQKPTIKFDILWPKSFDYYLNWVTRPSHLVPSDCSPCVAKPMPTQMDPQGPVARHTGSLVLCRSNESEQYSGVAAFRADVVAPLQSGPLQNPYYYFELTVTNKGKQGRVAIGFCHYNHFQASIQPGYYPQSCAYHGSSGHIFTGASAPQGVGPSFTEGDRVGAGIDRLTDTFFFTNNGKLICRTPNKMKTCALYPVVGLGSCGEAVRLDFSMTKNPLSRRSSGGNQVQVHVAAGNSQ